MSASSPETWIATCSIRRGLVFGCTHADVRRYDSPCVDFETVPLCGASAASMGARKEATGNKGVIPGVSRRTPPVPSRIDPKDGQTDDVSRTDGICVTSCPTSRQFGKGVFVVHDGANAGGNQNFKLYAWEDIAGTNLLIDTTWRPREMLSTRAKSAAGRVDEPTPAVDR